MPAIDPERLSQRAADLAEQVDRPEQLVEGICELLSFHEDRTRRPPATIRAQDALRQFGAPRPVVRMVSRALEESLRTEPKQRPIIARSLWEAGYRETRLIAADLLGGLAWENAHREIEARVRQSRDAEVRVRLAQALDASRRDRRGEGVREVLERWLRAREAAIQQLALRTLKTCIARAPAAELPSYLRLLEGLAGRLRPSARAAAQDMFRVIIDRSPPEAAQFLIDEVHRHVRNDAYRCFLKEVKSDFAEPHRSQLEEVLSS